MAAYVASLAERRTHLSYGAGLLGAPCNPNQCMNPTRANKRLSGHCMRARRELLFICQRQQPPFCRRTPSSRCSERVSAGHNRCEGIRRCTYAERWGRRTSLAPCAARTCQCRSELASSLAFCTPPNCAPANFAAGPRKGSP